MTAAATDQADSVSDFARLVRDVRDFSVVRGWPEVQTPKNLAMAICGEAGELAAELQWPGSRSSAVEVHQDAALRQRVAMEMADVLIYLARLADVSGIDLMAAAHEKLAINETRFPIPGETR